MSAANTNANGGAPGSGVHKTASPRDPEELRALREARFIGGLLRRPEGAHEYVDMLDRAHFWSGAAGKTFAGIKAVAERAEAPTVEAVASELQRLGLLRSISYDTIYTGVDALKRYVEAAGTQPMALARMAGDIHADYVRRERGDARQLAALRIERGDDLASIARDLLATEERTQWKPRATPTTARPLNGLERLSAVAIVGRDRVLGLAAKPIEYIWRDIAIAGIVVVIAGGPGSGKTTLLFLILVARMNRGAPVPVLGRDVTPAPDGQFVVLIEAEHADTSASRKLVRSCALLGVDHDALDRVILVARKAVLIGSPEWEEVGRLVAAGLVSDIALDTLARVAPADANDEREQVAIFDRVAQVIDMAPASVPKPIAWVAAHTRKGESSELTDVSGSTQRTGQADTVLLVQPERSDGRVVSSKVTFAKLREEPDEFPAPVTYAVTPKGIVGVEAAPKDDRPLEERILDRLALGPQTKNALAEALNRSPADVDAALSALFEGRHITTTTKVIRSRSYKAFQLRNDARPDARPGGRPD